MPDYTDLYRHIEPIVGDIFPVQGIIRIKLKTIQPIIALGYYLVPSTTEIVQMENAKRAYGV